VTAKLPSRCAACKGPLVFQPRGHGKRFCGVACRVAAYRRRQQGITERTPRWERSRGRLRLSRLHAFERRQAQVAEWRRQRDQRREQDRRLAEARVDPPLRRPPSRGEVEAMSDGELLALVQRPRPPLPDDWMMRKSPS
jgi:hypothetical protein